MPPRIPKRKDIEAVDGPYGRWLHAARERFGDKVFEMFADWPAEEVDRFMRALWITYPDSKFAIEEEIAQWKGGTSARFTNEDAEAQSLRRKVPDPRQHVVRYGNRRVVG